MKATTTVEPVPSRRVPLSREQLLRLILVGVFASGLLARSLPDAMRVIWPIGGFGYYTDGSGRVTSIAKGGPAAKAGLRVGDQIRVDLIPLEDRKPGLVQSAFSWYNWTRHIQVQRNHHTFAMTIEAVAEPPLGRLVVAVRAVIALAVVIIGALLVIVRPSIATWGFFIFAIGGGHQSTFLDTVLPYPWRPIENGVADALNAGANIGLLLFALFFMPSRIERFKKWVVGAALGLWLVAAMLWVYGDLALTYGGWQTAAVVSASHRLQEVLVAAALLVFVVRFLRSQGEMRQRTGWIVAAFVVSLLGRFLGDYLYPERIAYWEYGLLLSLQVLPAIAVAYGVIRKRIFDVDFVVSQALVYVALVGALVGVFALVDEGLSYYVVQNTDLAYAVILIVTFISSFAIGHARDVISRFVDRLFFRERRAMRHHLEHIARSLPLCEDRRMIERFLVDDIGRTLDLCSAAMFARRDDGSFERRRAVGWPEDLKPVLGADEPLVAYVEREWDAVDLDHEQWQEFTADLHAVTPVLVLPVIVAQRLELLLVYGLHTSGVALDPDELRLITNAAASAAIALANLRLRDLEGQVGDLERLREENARLRAQIAAMRQPAR